MEPFSIASFKFYSIAVIIISGGKSSVLLDVKPWDDETDMKKLEEAVRRVQMPGLLWGACTVGLHNLHICLLCLFYLFIYIFFFFHCWEEHWWLKLYCSETCCCWLWHKETSDHDDHSRWPSLCWRSHWGSSNGGACKWVHPELWHCCLQQDLRSVLLVPSP